MNNDKKIKNDKILNLVDRKPLHVIIQERQLKFINQILGYENNNLSKIYALYEPLHGKRKVGKPKLTYHKYLSQIEIANIANLNVHH